MHHFPSDCRPPICRSMPYIGSSTSESSSRPYIAELRVLYLLLSSSLRSPFPLPVPVYSRLRRRRTSVRRCNLRMSSIYTPIEPCGHLPGDGTCTVNKNIDLTDIPLPVPATLPKLLRFTSETVLSRLTRRTFAALYIVWALGTYLVSLTLLVSCVKRTAGTVVPAVSVAQMWNYVNPL
jgi:hypothetical protein